MNPTTKTFMWIGIAVIGIIVYNKMKKTDEPFIIEQKGGEPVIETK